MTGTDLATRRLAPGDREEWLPLWQGYLDFYGAALEPGITDLTWQRLHDPLEPMTGFGAVADGRLGGFVIMVGHRSTWARTGYAYLEDLFVAADLRGRGAGRGGLCRGRPAGPGAGLLGHRGVQPGPHPL